MNKLPNGWQIKTIKEVCNIYTGNSINKQKKEKNFIGLKEGLNYIGTKDISFDNIINYDNGVKIPFKDLKDFKIAKSNSALLCIEGGSAGRKIGFTNQDICFGNKLCCFEAIEDAPKFIYYYLQSDYFLEEFYSNMQGLIGGVNKENLKKIKIPIPPLDEQKCIASALSKIDAYLENTIKLIEEKERFKKGISKKLLNKEARFEGFNDEWKEYNLSKIGISYGGLRNKKAKSFSENCNAKYITYKSIYDKNKIDINRLGNVFVDKNENQNLVKYGDAFFTISSETPDEVAISSVLLDEVENTYLNSFCFGFRFDFNILLPEFARYYFRSDYIRKSTYRLVQGITRYNISKNKFLDIKIYLPSIKEQEEISKFLSLLDAEIDNLKEQKEEIKKMKSGVINKLMSGEIRI